VITTTLGFAFMIGQFWPGKNLVANRVHLWAIPQDHLLYMISGLHGAHVIGGVVYLLIILNVGQVEFMKGSIFRYILKPLSILLVIMALSIQKIPSIR
jgi:heme/copper-type cytochrome/quinol oxidase subunit 3